MSTHLVTGGAGFIGSYLVERLIARGDRVVVLDDLSTGDLANLGAVLDDPAVEFRHGSVLDEAAVDDAAAAADVVVHLAAAVGVRLIVEQPLESLTTNIRGAETVLAAADRHGCRFLVTSSSEIYGRNPVVPLREDSDRVLGGPTVARWAYSTAKAVDEILALAYHGQHGLRSTVVRLFNTVGPRQRADYGMVVPTMVGQALRGEPLTIHGDGRQTRCFCHVEDVVGALLALLDHPESYGQVFNVGSEDEISILDLARRIVERTGSSSPIVLQPYEEVFGPSFEDMRRRVPDTGRLRALTGWTPSHSLDEIIDAIVAARTTPAPETATGPSRGSRPTPSTTRSPQARGR